MVAKKLEVPGHLPPDIAEVWSEQVALHGVNAPKVVGAEFEAYCGVLVRLRDAQKRIHEEQLIVPDSKAAPVAHPALTIERNCIDELRKWGPKFKPPVGR